jgi:hypothetical protein
MATTAGHRCTPAHRVHRPAAPEQRRSPSSAARATLAISSATVQGGTPDQGLQSRCRGFDSLRAAGGHLKLPAGGQWIPNDGHCGVWSVRRECFATTLPDPAFGVTELRQVERGYGRTIGGTQPSWGVQPEPSICAVGTF